MIHPSHSWGYTQRNATQVTPEAPAAVPNIRAQERIHFMRGIDEHMKIRKESSMFMQ
jgi:hypothetical protein